MQINIKLLRLLTRVLMIGAVLASLTACGTQRVKVAKPATDLQMLQLGVHSLTEQRLPVGDIQHPDEAETNAQLMSVAVDLDNVVWLSNQDKQRLRRYVDSAVLIIAEGRAEVCSWWNVSCKRRRSASLEPLKRAEQR